jgi:general stress protein CsbA
MSQTGPTLVVIVHRAASPRRTGEIMKWVRWMLPAAMLVVARASAGWSESSEVITIDADAVESGPLSLADALTRPRTGR